MSKFNLTAQLSLAPPTNVPQIVRQVNQQLQGIQMQINPVVNAKSLNQANQAVQRVGVSAKVTSKNLNTAAGSANSLGSALGAAARRFASITLATGFFLALTRALGSAVGRAIEFEKEMLKISQVTGKSVRSLRDLSNEVTRLSGNLGVSSEELLNAARTLSQAGFAADKVTGALKVLAQTDLAATFDNIKDTTEGAIAILSQFRKEVRAAGGEVQFLEMAMDSINAVSKSFAVESADLISVVRRTGGVFEAAGGKLNELIALFTSVRATTRETADTIATGFRTIFTRIQRSETIDSLRELGIVLQDTEGKFVGPMQAIARLSAGLQALDPRDFRFNEIVEQLGGFRQIGKVIPLIKQYTTSTEALAVANNAMGSTARDAGIAQQGLGNQFAQLKEKFDATVRSLADSDTFQTLATSAIKMAEAILRIVDALEPLLPMLTALAAFKLGQIAIPAFGKFAGISANAGGKIHGFAGGGMVPGRGNRDTVPAMLEPGEFVMRKSAVKKIGANNIAQMNNGYAAGGIVTGRRNNYGFKPNKKTFDKALTPEDKARLLGTSELASKETSEDAKVLAAIGKANATYGLSTGTVPGGFSLDASTKQVKEITSDKPLGSIPLTKMTAKDFQIFAKGIMAKVPGSTIDDVAQAQRSGVTTNATMQASSYPIASIVESGVRSQVDSDLQASAAQGLKDSVEETISRLQSSDAGATVKNMGLTLSRGAAQRAATTTSKDEQAVSSMVGFLFEGVIDAMSGATPAGERASFDLPRESVSSARPELVKLFGSQANQMKMAEVKSSFGKLSQIPTKLKTFIGEQSKVGQRTTGIDLKRVGFAKGGKPKGTDTVPAMLTPGEFVMKKSAAQGIGYSNLHRMNQSNGVNGYAAGGIVTGTRGFYGNGVPGGGASIGTIPGIESASKGFTQLAKSIGDLVGQLIRAGESITLGANSASEKLVQGANVLGPELSQAGQAFIGLPATILNLLDDGAVQLGTGLADAAKGIGSIDNIMIEALTASLAPFTAAMADASKGISAVDNIMNTTMTGAMAPLKTSLSLLDGEFKKFGKELMLKLKYFDILKKANTDLVTVMNDLGKKLIEKGDDFDILKPPIATVEQALIRVSGYLNNFYQIFTPLAGAVRQLSVAMQNQAGTIAASGAGVAAGAGGAALQGPMTQLAANMSRAAKIMSNIAIIGASLQRAMANMVASLNSGKGSINNITINSAATAQELAELKAELAKAQARILELETAAAQASTQMKKTGASGGAAAGGMMMGGGGGGGQMGNNLMMAGMAAGMVAQSMDGLNDKTKTFVTDLTMIGMMLGMVAMSFSPILAGLFVLTGSSTTAAAALSAQTAATAVEVAASEAATLAKMQETGAGFSAAAIDAQKTVAGGAATIADRLKTVAAADAAKADAMKASAAMLAGGVMAGMAIAATYVIMRSKALGEQAKKLTEEYQDSIKGLQEGGAGTNLADAQAKVRAALQKEAEAAGATFSGFLAMTAAAIVVVVSAIALFIAGVATGGLAWAAAAAIFIGAAGAAGAEIGAAFATAEEAIGASTDALVASTFHAATALNGLTAANQAMELEQLSGVALMERQGQAFDDFYASSLQAAGAMASFQGMEAGMDQEFRGEMMDSDVFEAVKDGGVDAMKELSQAWFKMASDMKNGMNSAVDEMIKGGKSAKDAMDSAAIQGQLKKYGAAVEMATRLQMMMSGLQKQAAKQQLGLAGMTDAEMSRAQRLQVMAREKELIDAQSADTAKKASAAQEKSMRDRLEAEAKAKKAAAEKLAADIALAKQAYRSALALSTFEVAMVGLSGAMSMADMEFGALTGSIKQFKSVNDKLISTLASGNVSPEAEQAAMATAGQFGLEGETVALIQKMKDNEKIRKVLTEKGMEAFSGALEESAANLRFDEFMRDQGIDLSGLDADIRTEIMNMLEDGLQPGEIEEIMNKINGANEEQIKVLAELAKAQNDYVGALFKFGGEVVKLNELYAKAISNVISVQLKGAERLAKAQGRDMTVGDVRAAEEAKRRAPLQARGLVGGGVGATQIQLERNRQKARELANRVKAEAEGGQDAETITNLQNEQKNLASETNALTENLKKLSDQSKLAAAIMGEIDKEKGKRETIRGLISEFTFASNQGRKDMDRNFMALQRVMETGSLNSIPDEMRSAVGGLLGTLEDIAIGPQGQTGGEIKKMLEMQMANQLKIRATGRPLTAEEMQRIFDKTTKEEKLIDDLKALNAEEVAAATALADHQADKIDDLLVGIERLIATLEAAQANAGNAAQGAMQQMQIQGPMHGGLIQRFAEGGTTKAARYTSSSKNMFQPRGTDTVPAMLTPGEFVMQKSAVDSIGLSTLSSMNSGKKPIYRQAGGPVTSWTNFNQEQLNKGVQISPELQKIQDTILNGITNSINSIDKLNFAELNPAIDGKKIIEADTGWPMGGANWKNFEMDTGAGGAVFLQNGALARAALNDKAKQGIKAWSLLATPLGAINDPLLMANLMLQKYEGKDAARAIQAHRFFYNKTYPNGGRIGNNKNTLAYDWWDIDENTGTRNTLTALVTSSSTDDDTIQGDISGGLIQSVMGSGQIRDWYKDGGTGDLGYKDLDNVKNVERTGPAMANIFKQYTENSTWPWKSHSSDLYGGTSVAGINYGLPYPPSEERGLIIPNRATAGTLMGNPGKQQFQWLSGSRFRGTKSVEQNEEYYRALLKSGEFNDVKMPLFVIDQLAGGAMKSASSAYGSFLHDNLFNEAMQGQLKEFYTDPNAATAEFQMGNIANALTNAAYGNWSGTPNAQAMLKVDGAISAMPNFELDTAAKSGFTGGPFGDTEVAKAFKGKVGYIPWSLQHEPVLNRGLLQNLMDMQANATGRLAAANNITNGWGAEFTNLWKNSDAENKGQSAEFLATKISELFNKIEGGNDVWGAPLLGVIKQQQEAAAADAAAQEAAAVEEVEGRVVPNLDVFYGGDAQKAQALLTALGEYPGRDKAPKGIYRMPAYSGLRGEEGVIDEKTGNPRRIFAITDIKRNKDHFDAMFPFFKELSNEILGMAGQGYITSASTDGGVGFNPQKMADLGGGIGGASRDALARWSTLEDVSSWYGKDGLPDREAEKMIGLFWNFKKVNTALKKMQGNARTAMRMAEEQNNGMWARSGLFGGDVKNYPDWLKPAQRNQPNQRPNQQPNQPQQIPQQNAQGQAFATGGPVGIDWSPRGTDTVPAMLTPGEFVMKKSAVDKYGIGFMAAINEGRGGSGGYMHEGGVASGSVSQFGPQEDLRIDRVLSNTKTTSNTVKKIAGMITNVDNKTTNQEDLLNSFNTMSEADSALSAQIQSGLSAILNQRIDLPEDLGEGIVGRLTGEFLAQLGTLRQEMDTEHTDLKKQNRRMLKRTRGNFGILAGAIPAMMRPFNPAGPPQFMATGGMARGTDTVPAMLTPGEFVMKKSAVDKYGVGFMRSLNNGASPTSRSRGVQYLKNGDLATSGGGNLFAGVGDIVSSISDSLSAFTQAFSLFSGLSNLLSNTINSMADMNITHNININGSVNIPGFSKRAVKKIINAVVEEVVDDVDAKIDQAFAERDRNNENRT